MRRRKHRLYIDVTFSSALTRPYRSFKFEFGGSYIFYSGRNLGEAIRELIKHRGLDKVMQIESIEEQPAKDERA
jgi:hypothetical protein